MNWLLSDHSQIKIIDAVKRQLIQYFLSKTLGKYCKYSTKDEGFLYLHSIEVIQMPVSGWTINGTIESLAVPNYSSDIFVSRMKKHEINIVELQILVKNVELTISQASQQPKESLPEDKDLDILQDQLEYLVQHIHLNIENLTLLVDINNIQTKIHCREVSIIPTIHEIYNIALHDLVFFIDSVKVAQVELVEVGLWKDRIQIDSKLIHLFSSRIEILKVLLVFSSLFKEQSKANSNPLQILYYFDQISAMYYLNPHELRPFIKIDLYDCMGSAQDMSIQRIDAYFEEELIGCIYSDHPPNRVKQTMHELWSIDSNLRQPGLCIRNNVYLLDQVSLNASENVIKSLLFTTHKWPKFELNNFELKEKKPSIFSISIVNFNINSIIDNIDLSLTCKSLLLSPTKIEFQKFQFLLNRSVLLQIQSKSIINYILSMVPELIISLGTMNGTMNQSNLNFLFSIYSRVRILKQQAEDMQDSVFYAAKETLDIASVEIEFDQINLHLECPSIDITTWYRLKLLQSKLKLLISNTLEVNGHTKELLLVDSNEREILKPIASLSTNMLVFEFNSDLLQSKVIINDLQYISYPRRPVFLDLKAILPIRDSKEDNSHHSLTIEFLKCIVSLETQMSSTFIHFNLDKLEITSLVQNQLFINLEKTAVYCQDPIASMMQHDEQLIDYDSKSIYIGQLNKCNIAISPHELTLQSLTKISNSKLALCMCPDSARLVFDFLELYINDSNWDNNQDAISPQTTEESMESEPLIKLDLGECIMSDGFECYMQTDQKLPILPNYFLLKSQKLKTIFPFLKVSNIDVVINLFDGFDFPISIQQNDTYGKRSLNPFVSIHFNSISVKFESSKVDTTLKIQGKCKVFEVIDHLDASTWHKSVVALKKGFQQEALFFKFKIEPHDVLINNLSFECKCIPLKLNIDQDTLNFLLNFWFIVQSLNQSETKEKSVIESPYFCNLYLYSQV